MNTGKYCSCGAALSAFAAGLWIFSVTQPGTVSGAACVDSLNTVAYVRLSVPAGGSLIANPLNGTNNNLATIFPEAPNGATATFLSGGTPVILHYSEGWDVGTTLVDPGRSFFMNPGSPATFTLVGEVPQGTLANSFNAGTSYGSSQAPQAGRLQTDLGFQPVNDVSVFLWNGSGYSPYSYAGSWTPAEPVLQIGQGFVLQADSDIVWSRYFAVQRCGATFGPGLSIQLLPNGDVQVSWTDATSAWRLIQADQVEGPFATTPGSPASPYIISASLLESKKFFALEADPSFPCVSPPCLPTNPHSYTNNLLVYEGFEYETNTQLYGRNGGFGWTGPWTTPMNPVFSLITNQSSSLVPVGQPDYATAGGRAAIYLPPSVDFNVIQRPLDLATTNLNELWMSVVITPNGRNAGNDIILQVGENQQIRVGAYSAGTAFPVNWSFFQDPGQGPRVVAFEPALLVLRLTHISLLTLQCDMRINPLPGTNLSAADATVLFPGTRIEQIKGVQIIARGAGSKSEFDDIRFAPSYPDLNPLPVPCLQILFAAPVCASGPSVPIRVSVSGCTNVTKLAWDRGDNVEHIMCEDCGANPSFTFDLPVNGPCAETSFTVTAYDANGGVSRKSSVVPADQSPPTLTCGSNKTVSCGTKWVFDPPVAFDLCCASNVTMQLISSNAIASTVCSTVWEGVWRVTDCCTNSATCTQTVTVVNAPATPVNTVLFFQNTSGALKAWYMDHNNRTGESLLHPSTTGDVDQRLVASGDFNGDGNPDLLFQRADTLKLWYMDGINRVAEVPLTPSELGTTDWRVAGLGDFDNDGEIDLVFQHTDFELSAWLMNGTTLISLARFNPTNPGRDWWLTSVGDIDSDGHTDLVFQDTLGILGYWALDGVNMISIGLFEPPQADGSARLASTIDLDEDGHDDLIFQLPDGSLSYWSMNGISRIGEGTLVPPNPGGTWRLVATSKVAATAATQPVHCPTKKVATCGNPWSFDPPTVGGCCGTNVLVTVQSTVTNAFPPLTVTRTWRVMDCCSNVTTCSQTVVSDCGLSDPFGWEQPPGYEKFPQSPDRHGGGRPSSIDWVTLVTAGTTPTAPNHVVADDFQTDGQPICTVRWWGSYPPGFEPTNETNHFEDGFILSFFSNVPGGFPHPDNLLGAYVAPMTAVLATAMPYAGADGNRIYRFEVNLADACLDHGTPGIATPSAFVPASNGVYWLAITAEVGHRIIPIRNTDGVIVDWLLQTTAKRATNDFWNWQTSPRQWGAISVSGHVFMSGLTWDYPPELWESNQVHHLELDQAFAFPGGPQNFDGLINTPQGGASVQVFSNQLVLSNIGSTGQDGVGIGLGKAQFGSVLIECQDPDALATGASLAFRAIGEVNGTNDQLVAEFKATDAESDIVYSCQFPWLRGAPLLALVYDDNRLVAFEHLPPGVVRFASITGLAGDARITPFLPASGRPWMILEFTESHPLIALTGGQLVSGNRIAVTPDVTKLAFPDITFDVSNVVTHTGLDFWWNPIGPIGPGNPGDPPPYHTFLGSLSRIEVLAADVPEVRILSEQVGMFGLAHKSVGGAALQGLEDSFKVVPTTNQLAAEQGIDITAGGAETWNAGAGGTEFAVRWLDLTAQPGVPIKSLPVGAFLRAGIRGATFSSALEVSQTTSNTVSFAPMTEPLGAGLHRIEIWRDGTLAATTLVANATAATDATWPTRFNLRYSAADGLPQLSYQWQSNITFNLSGAGSVIGNELRVGYINISNPLPANLRPGLRLGGGLSELRIIGEKTAPAGLVYQGLAHLSLSNATLQVSGSELVVSNSAAAASFGASVILGDAGHGMVNMAGFAPSDLNGAGVRVRAFGTLNNVPDRYLGAVLATKNLTNTVFNVDRSVSNPNPIPSFVVSVYDGPQLMKTSVNVSNLTVLVPSSPLAWRCTPILPAAPGSIATRLEFDQANPVVVAGEPAVLGDRIDITDFDPMHTNRTDVSSVSRLEIVGTGLKSFRIVGEELGMFRRGHQALGQLRLLAVGDVLRVDSFAATEREACAVRFPLTGADSFTAFWFPLDPFNALQPGAQVRGSLEASVNGNVPQVIGFSQVTSLGSQKEIAADFSTIGVSSRLVELLHTNVLVFSTTLPGAGGPVAQTMNWPAGISRARPVPPPWPNNIAWHWSAPTVFEVSGRSIVADQIRISAQIPGEPPVLLSAIRLQAYGLQEINLVADIARTAAPVTAKAQIVGGTLVVTWDVLDSRQVLQQADSVDGLWKDVPGATTSPYLVPLIGQKKFLRVKNVSAGP